MWSGTLQQLWLRKPGELIAINGAEPAIVSETFARRFDLLKGGEVVLGTPTGSRRVSPIGIYSDYGSEFGSAVIDKVTWEKWAASDRPINTSLYLDTDMATNSYRDMLRLRYPGLDIRNAAELRTLALSIFDQTFRVTTALNGIGLCVAFLGLSPGFLAIDQEPIAPMIKNHRTGLLWKGFMRSEVGIRIIQKIRIARPVAESFDSLSAYDSIWGMKH